MQNTKRKTLVKTLLIVCLVVMAGIAFSLALLNQPSAEMVYGAEEYLHQNEMVLIDNSDNAIFDVQEIIDMYKLGLIDSFEAQALYEEYTRIICSSFSNHFTFFQHGQCY